MSTPDRLVAVHPDPPPAELARALDLGGHRWKAVVDAGAAEAGRPPGGWSAAVVVVTDDDELDTVWALCRQLRNDPEPAAVLLLVSGARLDELDTHLDLFDDFCLHPFHPRELEVRLAHLAVRSGRSEPVVETIDYGPLSMNLQTYQAVVDGRPLDLTYMEYELLRFLASHPGRVFTREAILNQVWGYDYYGGARTVDVHVRRLRAKLGEEHAGLIETVRSVGYRFGQSRWQPR